MRFDTDLGYRDCIPAAHEFMSKKLGLTKPGEGQYAITNYQLDPEDQNARVLTILLGVVFDD